MMDLLFEQGGHIERMSPEEALSKGPVVQSRHPEKGDSRETQSQEPSGIERAWARTTTTRKQPDGDLHRPSAGPFLGSVPSATELMFPGETKKSVIAGALVELDEYLEKASSAPFIGPRGGKWADPQHTIPFKEGISRYKLEVHGRTAKEARDHAARVKTGIERAADICKITPPVCEGNLGIPRKDMPQLPKSVIPRFLAHMEKQGAKVQRNQTMAVGQLKATQREINAEKVQGMAEAYKAGTFDPSKEPIIVSNDGYILDGHHRWAAMLHLGPGNKMHVHKVDAPIKKILEEANAFEGVTQAGFGAPSAVEKSMVLGEALSWALRRRPLSEGLEELGAYLGRQTMHKAETPPEEHREGSAAERFGVAIGEESGPPSVEKSAQTAFEELDDYIEKAGGSGALPTGEPGLGTGVEVQRPTDGGKLAGVGETRGDVAPATDYWSSIPAAKQQTLSADDVDPDEQMKPGTKPIEQGGQRMGTGVDAQKSMTAGYSAQEARYQTARANAAVASRLRRGDADLVVGVGVAAAALDHPAGDLDKATVWTQGEDSVVRYSDAADIAADRLQKSEGFHSHGSPTLAPPRAVISQAKLCKSCGTRHAAMLSTCPACGAGGTVISPAPGAFVGGGALVLEKSLAPPILRPRRQETDLYLPDGCTLE